MAALVVSNKQLVRPWSAPHEFVNYHPSCEPLSLLRARPGAVGGWRRDCLRSRTSQTVACGRVLDLGRRSPIHPSGMDAPLILDYSAPAPGSRRIRSIVAFHPVRLERPLELARRGPNPLVTRTRPTIVDNLTPRARVEQVQLAEEGNKAPKVAALPSSSSLSSVAMP